jgi:site-specific DNA recombinase
MEKALAYIRVSSVEQGEGYSLDAQSDLLKGYAQRKGIQIVEFYVEKESAKTTGREKFDLMIEKWSKTVGIKSILVEKPDRLARNNTDSEKVEKIIKTHRKELHFVKNNEVITSRSHSSKFMMWDFNNLMSKQFIRNLSEETIKGMQQKLESGGYPFPAPIGYLNDRLEKTIVLDTERAPLVRKIFEMYSTGNHTYASIARKIWDLGLRTRKSSHRIYRQKVQSIINSTFYYGLIKVKGESFRGTHEPLISKALYDKCQLVAHRGARSKHTKYNHAFLGMVRCGHTGIRLTPDIKIKPNGKTYTYYKGRKVAGVCEKAPNVNENVLSDMLGEIVSQIQIPKEVVDRVTVKFNEYRSNERLESQKQTQRLKSELLKTREMKEKCLMKMLDGTIDDATWKSMNSKFDSSIFDLEGSIVEHEKNKDGYLIKGVELLQLASRAHEMYLKQDNFERSRLVKTCLSNLVWKDGSLGYDWIKPFDLMAKCSETKKWGGRWGSNPRQPESQSGALPTELRPPQMLNAYL